MFRNPHTPSKFLISPEYSSLNQILKSAHPLNIHFFQLERPWADSREITAHVAQILRKSSNLCFDAFLRIWEYKPFIPLAIWFYSPIFSDWQLSCWICYTWYRRSCIERTLKYLTWRRKHLRHTMIHED